MKTTNGHPTTEIMVTDAIVELNEKKGVSIKAIKSHIQANYPELDMHRMNSFINKFVNGAVDKGLFIQTTGTGANGRFKLNKDKHDSKANKRARTTSTAKVEKKTTVKKTVPKDTAKSPRKASSEKAKNTTTAKKATVSKERAAGGEAKKTSSRKK